MYYISYKFNNLTTSHIRTLLFVQSSHFAYIFFFFIFFFNAKHDIFMYFIMKCTEDDSRDDLLNWSQLLWIEQRQGYADKSNQRFGQIDIFVFFHINLMWL